MCPSTARILYKAIELRMQREAPSRPTSENDSSNQNALTPTSYHPPSPSAPVAEVPLEQLMQLVLARLKEPVRLEVRVLDDRVIARRLDGNRGVSVDMSRGPRMIGYVNI